jgi:hypothetical protein
MENVKSFAINKGMREDVQLYIHSYLEKKLLERAFAGFEVKDIAESKRVIDEAFTYMVLEFVRTIDMPEVNENE